MSLYDLVVDGSAALYARRASAQRLVRREPLVGLTDGVNTIFLTPHKPFLYDSLSVYTAQAPLTPAALWSADPDGGVIRFGSAPVGSVVADYIAVPLTLQQVANLALAGFDLLQSMWNRDLFLSSSAVTYVQAAEGAPHMYIAAWDGATLSDPVCGALTFSTSVRQRGLLTRCIDLAFLDAALTDAALMDVAIRERAGGIAVDPMRRTDNIIAARDALWMETLRALELARQEWGVSDDSVASVPAIHTDEYENVWHWQARSVPVGRRYPGQ